ncbi:MAG TPA: hypothetical protein VHC68_03585 [Candidatus Paceibacterota bacterium]|nr:hypothetical protein [Candidatus Paceibacterota bacterium]
MATSEEVAAMQKEAAYVTSYGEDFFLENLEKILSNDPGAIFVAIDVDHHSFVTGVSRKEVHDKADKNFPAGSRAYVRGIKEISPDVVGNRDREGPCGFCYRSIGT